MAKGYEKSGVDSKHFPASENIHEKLAMTSEVSLILSWLDYFTKESLEVNKSSVVFSFLPEYDLQKYEFMMDEENEKILINLFWEEKQSEGKESNEEK